MKQTTFTFLFICMCFTAKAQQRLSYAYDAAGNRIGRSIVLQAQASKTLRKTTDSTFVYEMLAEKQLKIYPNPVNLCSQFRLPVMTLQCKVIFLFLIIRVLWP